MNVEPGPAMLDKLLAAAHPDSVFSRQPETNGVTVITAREVMGGGGFGVGQGAEGGGSGGGGWSFARPVAAIVISPDGVKVRPIVDVTKLGIAAVTAWAAVALTAMRLVRK